MTYRVVTNFITNRCGNDVVSQLHGEVLSTEARSLEALVLNVCERTNGAELFGELADFGEGVLEVEVHHGLGSSDELNLAIVCGDVLSTNMGVVESEVLMMIDEFEGNGSQCSLKHVLGGGSGTQVVKTSVKTAVAGSVVRSSNTVVDQTDKTSLRES
jgi:hypothetical protein